MRRQLQRVLGQPRHLPEEAHVLSLVTAMSEGEWSEQVAGPVQRQLRSMLDRLRRYQASKGRRGFQAWVQASLKQGGEHSISSLTAGASPSSCSRRRWTSQGLWSIP